MLSAPMIAGFVAFATLAFAFALYHVQTLREESAKAWRKKIVERQNVATIEEKPIPEELESVETSQTLRTARERFEEQYEARMRRVHLITFKATAEEAEYILENLPDSEYLYNLTGSDLDGHVCEVRLSRARSHSH
jgi:hypothetical protein